MNKTQFHDFQYIDLAQTILNKGVKKTNRTGIDTYSVFGHQLRFNLENNTIPLLTTKKMHTKSIIHELLWFINGDTNIKYLNDNGVRIWNEWADENGDLGPIYGKTWRKWAKYNIQKQDSSNGVETVTATVEYIDQLNEAINALRTKPNDRRIIVNAWNVGELDQMKLPPCHLLYQFWTNGNDELKCHLYQRSADYFLGVPFNIAQYSIFTHMIAQITGLKASEFIWTGGDVHIYENHKNQIMEQSARTPYESPTLRLNPDIKNINDFTYDDFEIINYNYHPTIKAPVAV